MYFFFFSLISLYFFFRFRNNSLFAAIVYVWLSDHIGAINTSTSVKYTKIHIKLSYTYTIKKWETGSALAAMSDTGSGDEGGISGQSKSSYIVHQLINIIQFITISSIPWSCFIHLWCKWLNFSGYRRIGLNSQL